MPSATIVGAGPVGCLAALGLAKRGYEVVIYEGRTAESFASPSSSSSSSSWARSINLAISVRGLTALSAVDPQLAQRVLDEAVPMKGRMIHSKPAAATAAKGKRDGAATYSADKGRDVHLDSQAYSIEGKCIHSVSRALLSQLLLDEVRKSNRIEMRWSHRLRAVTFSQASSSAADLHSQRQEQAATPRTRAELTFEAPGCAEPVHVTTDVVFACDGHHSKVRAAMQREGAMSVTESNIDPLYLELHVPPGTGGGYAMDPHHLHIWPRLNYMLIALPNRDKSFTATLFAPQTMYSEHLQDASAARAFFRENFPDAFELGGGDGLVEQVIKAKPSPLGMVQCSAYHLDGAALLLGDAAHAMVPFYGQGLNCGLEDVRIMLEVLDAQQGKDSRSGSADGRRRIDDSGRMEAFEQYTAQRHEDLIAICQLAMDNYTEMSNKVTRPDYLLRKRLDGLLERSLPSRWWASLYTLVTFSNVGYAAARKQEARQARMVQVGVYAGLAGAAIAAATGMRIWSTWRRSA